MVQTDNRTTWHTQEFRQKELHINLPKNMVTGDDTVPVPEVSKVKHSG